MNKRLGGTIALLGDLALVLGACTSSNADGAFTTERTESTEGGGEISNGAVTSLPVVDPIDWYGEIVSAGSSTVFPLSEAVPPSGSMRVVPM